MAHAPAQQQLTSSRQLGCCCGGARSAYAATMAGALITSPACITQPTSPACTAPAAQVRPSRALPCWLKISHHCRLHAPARSHNAHPMLLPACPQVYARRGCAGGAAAQPRPDLQRTAGDAWPGASGRVHVMCCRWHWQLSVPQIPVQSCRLWPKAEQCYMCNVSTHMSA